MNRYLKGIIESEDSVLEEIYSNFYPPLLSFVKKNQGNESEAKDVFQEALVATYRRLQKNDFQISSTFGTYIFSVGKFIWFKKLKKMTNVSAISDDTRIADDTHLQDELEEESKYQLFQEGIARLGSDCRKVLNFFFDRKNFKEIALLMEYTGAEYARRKKYLCTKELMQKIKQDARYLEIYKS